MIQNYFLKIESLIYSHPIVKEVLNIEREIIDSNRGWFKAKLVVNDHELHVFEFVAITKGRSHILKYGYHLQTESGSLVVRWDNAEHYREIETFPYHVHITDEKNVRTSGPMNLELAFERISEILQKIKTEGEERIQEMEEN